jgi:hypothetical protein
MMMHSNTNAFLGLLLVVLALALTPTDAVWSYFSSFSTSGEEEDSSDLVSPLVNREIQVSVKAPWASSPYNVFCEAWTFTKDWKLLDRLAAESSSSSEEMKSVKTYKEATDHVVALMHDDDNDDNEDWALLRFALTMRAQSPTCELHRGLAEREWANLGTTKTSRATNAFAVVNGKFAMSQLEELPTNTNALPELSDDERNDLLLPGEKIHPNAGAALGASAGGLIVLYANLGTSDFKLWYDHLVASNLPFVVRHLGSSKDETDYTTLQGYGVRLDIRNVEYKVFDDRSDDDDAVGMVNSSALEALTPHFLAGVNLTALGLSENTMELQAALWKVQEASEQHSAMIPPAWQRRKLSVQAATVIANAPGNELFTLQDISQNLPSVASTLVHVEVPEEIEEVVIPMEDTLQSMIRSSGGGLWINGKPLPIERPSFNVFEMIHQLQKEQAALDSLSDKLAPYLVNPAQALAKIQKAWSQGGAFFSEASEDDDDDDEEDQGNKKGTTNAHPRINVYKGEKRAVMYINDIEKDPMYKQWPGQVRNAIMAMQYGMAPSVRRNLFTVLTVYDPTVPASNMGTALFQQLAQGQFPARMGALVVDQNDIEQCAEWVKETKPEEGVPCPFDDSFWLGEKGAMSNLELQDTPVTARDIHRLFAYMAKEYKNRREILMMYEQYMAPSMAQNPPTNGKFFSMYEVMLIHAEILVGTQVLNQAPSPAETVAKLMKMDKDAGADYSYGYALRFAVDKGLKVGMSFINGRPLPTEDDEDGGERTSSIFMEEQEVIFGMIMSNDITDSTPTSIYRKMLTPDKNFKASKNVFPRVHPLLSSPSEGAYVEVEHEFGPKSLLTPTNTGSPVDVNAIFGVDAVLETDTAEGLDLAKKFLSIMESFSNTVSDTPVSIAFRVIPSTASATADSLCPIFASASKLGIAALLEIIDLKVQGKDAAESSVDAALLEGAIVEGKEACSSPPSSEQDLPSKNFINANGRVYNIESLPLDDVDIELLLSMELEQSTTVTKFIKDHLEPAMAHDAVARTAAFLAVAKGGSQARYSPDDSILALEAQSGVQKNPLRFNWNEISEGDALKVNIICVIVK